MLCAPAGLVPQSTTGCAPRDGGRGEEGTRPRGRSPSCRIPWLAALGVTWRRGSFSSRAFSLRHSLCSWAQCSVTAGFQALAHGALSCAGVADPSAWSGRIAALRARLVPEVGTAPALPQQQQHGADAASFPTGWCPLVLRKVAWRCLWICLSVFYGSWKSHRAVQSVVLGRCSCTSEGCFPNVFSLEMWRFSGGFPAVTIPVFIADDAQELPI